MKTRSFIFVTLLAQTNIALCANTLFYNGKIQTELNGPETQWLFVKNGRVHSSGKENPPEIDSTSEKIDLKGAYLFPSLTDAHAHTTDIGREKFQIDLKGTKSPEEVVERIKSFLKSKPISAPSPIIGNGWDQSDWPDKQYSSREVLDQITTNQPILLYRVDGHSAWVNTYALKESKIWEEKADPIGGKIFRNAEGTPTGILVDNAMEKLDAFKLAESDSQVEEYILEAVKEAASLGITGIHDAGASGQQIESMRKLLKKKKVRFRFYEMLSLKDTKNVEKYLKSGPELDSEDGQLTVRSVKFYADGAMGSRGAAFREPYKDDPKNKGLLNMQQLEMEDAFKKFDQAGFQIAIHAIGSYANHLAINAMEKSLGTKIKDKRPRLEHTQVLEKNDIARVAKLGIIPSMQPVHCTSDMKWVEQRIGKERARFSYAWNSLLKAGASLAFGSDAPVELINPWHGLFASVTRQNKDFEPKNGFNPQEKISLKEAYKAFSEGAAYSSFSERMLGKLSNGAWADFIITDKNPLEQKGLDLRNFEVRQTWVGGVKVFEKSPNI